MALTKKGRQRATETAQSERIAEQVAALVAQQSGQITTGDVAKVPDRERTPKRFKKIRKTARLARRGARWSITHRRGLAPLAAGAVLYAGAAGLHYTDGGVKTAAVVAAGGAAAIGAYEYRRHAGKLAKHLKRRPVSQLVWGGATYLTAATWLLTAAAWRLGPPMPGFWGAALLGCAIPWWWRHRVRAPRGSLLDPRILTWTTRVAAAGCAIPGSVPHPIVELPDGIGWAIDVELPGGKTTTADVITPSTVGKIAGAYRVNRTAVSMEPHPSGDESMIRVMLLENNPLQDIYTFTGPTLTADGQCVIGTHADATPAWWRLFRPGWGACHGLIFGTTGAGKSGLVNCLCAEVRHSGIAELWLCDPEGGESVPDWPDYCDMFGGTLPRIRRVLQAAERVMASRRKRRGGAKWTDALGRTRRGRGSFTPTPEDPLIYLIVDEAPVVMADEECARIIRDLLKRGRKWGIGVVLITQVPSVAELGGDVLIRSMLSSSNVVMFRTSDKMSAQMGNATGLAVDPSTIPVEWPDKSSTAGLGYATSSGRLAAFRGSFIVESIEWADGGVFVPGNPADREAAGPDYTAWRDWLDMEEDEEDNADEPATTTAAGSKPAKTAKKAPQRTAGATNAAIVACLTAAGGGPLRTGVIADRTNLPLPTVSAALRRMSTKKGGPLTDTGYGEYALTETETSETAAA